MLVMQVYLNEKLVLSCGGKDLSMLCTTVYAFGNLSDNELNKELLKFDFNFGGLPSSEEDSSHKRWITDEVLSIGDKLSIEFVESNDFDQPASQELLDNRIDSGRAQWEDAKEIYFSLKHKYE